MFTAQLLSYKSNTKETLAKKNRPMVKISKNVILKIPRCILNFSFTLPYFSKGIFKKCNFNKCIDLKGASFEVPG